MKAMTWKKCWECLSDNEKIYRPEAEDYVARLEKTIQLSSDWRILDFGCGFGYVANILAPKVKEIFIWDEAENMRSRASFNTSNQTNVKCLNDFNDQVLTKKLMFNLILVNSVVQ
jgi:protein-L-isoaspartate O-methyltransferase